jgi:outer membrane protein OmpA-like peptidoglycan-associated protein
VTRGFASIAAASAFVLATLGGCSAHRAPTLVAAVPPHPEQRDIATLSGVPSRVSERGLVLTLGDGLFDADKADLKADGRRDLVVIAEYLKAHTAQRVLIEGHSDDSGNEAAGREISLRRATAVETFLLRNGVDPERLEVRGLGATKPVASNATRSGRRQNRRVEIVLPNAGSDRTVGR